MNQTDKFIHAMKKLLFFLPFALLVAVERPSERIRIKDIAPPPGMCICSDGSVPSGPHGGCPKGTRDWCTNSTKRQ